VGAAFAKKPGTIFLDDNGAVLVKLSPNKLLDQSKMFSTSCYRILKNIKQNFD